MLTEDDLRVHLRRATSPVPSTDLLAPLRRRQARRHRRLAVGASAGAVLAVTGALVALTSVQGASRPDVVSVASEVSPQPTGAFTVPPKHLLPSSSIVALAPLHWRDQDGTVVAYLQRYPTLPATEISYCEGWADATGEIQSVASCVGPARVQNGNDLVFPAQGVFVSNSTSNPPGSRPTTPPCAHGPSGNTLATLTSLRTTSVSVELSDGSTQAFSVVPGSEDWPVRLWSGTLPDRTFVVSETLRDADGTVLNPPYRDSVPTCTEFDSWRPAGS